MPEPVVAPVRRVVRPVQLGGVSLDLAVTLVFVAVVVLRQLVLLARPLAGPAPGLLVTVSGASAMAIRRP